MAFVSNFSDFLNQFRSNVDKFRSQRNDLLLGAVLDTKALIQFRIQSEGRNSELIDFDPYTPAYQRSKEKFSPNARSGIVDFTVSGRLWRNIKAFIVEESPERIIIELRADNELDQVKLNSFLKKWGNILTPSQEEIDMLAQVQLSRLEIFNQ